MNEYNLNIIYLLIGIILGIFFSNWDIDYIDYYDEKEDEDDSSKQEKEKK